MFFSAVETYEWDMYDVLGIHFPSDEVLADQNMIHLASQGRKPLQNTRNISHSRHASQDLRIAVLQRNFFKRDRSSTSPCTFSIPSSDYGSPDKKSASPDKSSEILFEETNQHEIASSASTVFDSIESPTALGSNSIPTSSLESSPGSNVKKDLREAKISSSDTKLYTKSPVSQKTRSTRKGKLLKALSVKSLSKASRTDGTKEQLNNQKFVDSFENNKQDYNNDKLHSGEGDAQQVSHDNNCPVDLELKSNNNHYTSNKVSHFSKTHKCGTCLALEQQKQKFRSVKLEFSSETELKSHNCQSFATENGMGDKPFTYSVCVCDEFKKQSPESSELPEMEFVISPERVFFNQQPSKSLSPESKSPKGKTSKSPLEETMEQTSERPTTTECLIP